MSPFEKMMAAGGFTGVPAIDFVLMVGMGVALGTVGIWWFGMLTTGGRGTAYALAIGVVVMLWKMAS